MSRAVTIEGLIVQAKPADLYKPWIRVAKNKREDIANKEFVKVRANNKTVYCQLRGTSNEDSEKIEMSEHYRELLGWKNKPTGNVKLDITRINQFWGILRTLYYHPDDFGRFAIGLGATSLFIALISLLISILQSISPTTFWLTIIFGLTIAFVIGFLISMAISFLKPLKRGEN